MGKDKKKNKSKSEDKNSDGKKASGRIAIIVSKFNPEVTGGLLNGALATLKDGGMDEKNINIINCPGAFEIPLIAKQLCRSGKYCAIICLGAVIKGDTAHFEYISNAVTNGIASLTLEYNTPISFGVLTTYDDEQAVKRSSNDEHNKGIEAAKAAMEMIALLKTL